MKPKTMILMAVAIVCGLAASYLASILLQQQQKMVKVIQVKEKMIRWTPIRADKIQEAEIPEKDAPKNYIPADPAKWAEVNGRMLIKNIDAGLTLTYDDLQSRDKGGLETELSPGMVAVAVRISAETGVGGFVLPGSRVNVVHQTRDNRGGEAKIILQNVLVKAVDLLPVRPEDRAGIVGATATLEVTPDDGLKLTAAQGTGTLFLQLRPYGDDKVVAEKDAEPGIFIPPPPPPTEKKVEIAAQDPKNVVPETKKAVEEEHVVTVINAGKVKQHVFELKDGKPKGRSKVREIDTEKEKGQ